MPAAEAWAIATTIVAGGWAVHATALHHRLGTWKTDPVTSLPVRAAFYSRATHHLRRPGTVIAVLDLDRFKAINDTHGHEFGDQVLTEIADRLRAYFGPTALICRLGGDEFAIIAQLGPAGGPWQESVDGVRALLAEPMNLPVGPRIQVTTSIGAVHLNETRRPNLSAALRLADQCMYTSKKRQTGLTAFTAQPDSSLVTTAPPTNPHRRPRDLSRHSVAG